MDIIHGQATIAREILNHIQPDFILVPVGGGGLISGIAAYVKAISPHTKVIGCLPENSPVMAKSIEAGHIIEMESQPTLSDATAGGIEAGAITFPLCQQWVDDYILLPETAIQQAIQLMIEKQHLLIEGAAALTISALVQHKNDFKNAQLVTVLSGGNIGLDMLRSVV